MFEIKEVAPTQAKSAFWAKDIKAARELNQKKDCPPVNVSVIRQGLKSALNRQPSEKPVSKVKIQPSPRRKPAATRPYNLNSAFAFEKRKDAARPSIWGASAAEEEDKDEEEVDDNVRYVGLEDMAKLLGFDEEDEDEDATVVAGTSGKWRFF